MKNKKIFITGGAGYLGANLIKKWYDSNEITIYSRDEAKHYFLKKQFPKLNCIIGDVRNLDLMRKSSKNHDIGVFAASLKQIESVDQNVSEANEIIIHGGLNSRIVAEENLQSACFISTDKSRSATTIYGAMKFVAGEAFIVNSESSKTNLSTAIYGNVINSTGSIIPLIWDAINNNYQLTLYSELMTRFILLPHEAVDVIEFALSKNGYNVIPKAKSILIKDLFDIFSQKFGLKYINGSPRVSEKIHEIMVSQEESPRVFEESNYFLMHSKTVYNQNLFKNSEYSSKDFVMDKHELELLLERFNFFRK
jgi:UDP-N-acetylglucosamine 4,6-dehydratase